MIHPDQQQKSGGVSRGALPLLIPLVALLLSACGGRNDMPNVANAAHLFDLKRSNEGIALIQAPTLEAASAGLGCAYATSPSTSPRLR